MLCPAYSVAPWCLLFLPAFIVTGYTPRADDLWILLIYAAGFLSALVGMTVWQLH
jgi:hypothetical protein